MNTLDFLLEKYNPAREPKIEVYNSRAGSLVKIFRQLGFTVGAEVGVARGYFSKFLCEHIPNLKLYSIDAWELWPGATHGETQATFDLLYKSARERLAPLNCQIISDWSMNAVKRFADESLDFVYIDGAHDYKNALQDIREWSKKVKKGGIVSGHDYAFWGDIPKSKGDFNEANYSVKKAVDDYVKANGIKYLFVFNKDFAPSWFYVKEKNDREQVSKGIIYYTDNQLDEKIMKRCQEQLKKVESSKLPIVSVSLKPIDFGVNYVLPLERGYLTLAKQILKGLEESTADVIFFCEHDVLYHPSHFDFTPPKRDVYYYNTNSWMLRASDGHALYYDHKSFSGMSCYRETAIKHFKERIRRIKKLEASAVDGIVKAASGNDIPLKEGIHRLGFEPGTHNRLEKIDDLKAESYRSAEPNVDIRHKGNLTQSRWSIDKFRDKSVAKTWKEADEIPGWGKGINILNG